MATDLEKLVVQYSADIKSFENTLARMQGVSTKTHRRIKQDAGETGKAFDAAAVGVQRFGASTQQTANNVVAFRSRIQQVSFQVQDFAVQVGAGTSATQALSQQLPQLLGAFGAIGALLGAGAAIGIPLLAVALRAAGEESIALDDRLKSLNEALQSAQAASAEFGLSQEDLAKKFAGTTEQVNLLMVALANRELENLGAQIKAAGEAAFEPFSESIEKTRLEFEALGLAFSDSNAIERLAMTFGLTIDQVSALVAEMERFNAATTDDQRNAVIQDTRALLEGMRETLGTLPPEAEAFYQSMLNVAESISQATAGMTGLQAATAAAAAQAAKTAAAYAQLADAVALANSQQKARLDAATSGLGSTEDSRNINDRGLGLTHADRSGLTVSQGGFKPDPKPKSGGRDKAASEAEREAAAVVKLIEALQFEQSLIGLTDLEREKANQLRRAGAAATEEQRAQIEALVTASFAETEAMKATEEQLERIKGLSKDVLGGMFEDLRDGASAADVLANALNRVAESFVTSGIEALIDGTFSGGGKSGGGFFGAVARMFAPTHHDGGVVTGGGTGRMVSPSDFHGAKRYHGGGVVSDLRPGEVPIIAQAGERVIPKGGSGATMLEVVLSPDLQARILNAAAGQSVKISQASAKDTLNRVPAMMSKSQLRG